VALIQINRKKRIAATIYDPFAEALDKCRAAHGVYAGIYKAECGASDGDIQATRARFT
jgi:hypothetical protein